MEEIARQSFRIIKFRSRVSHIAIYFNGSDHQLRLQRRLQKSRAHARQHSISHQNFHPPRLDWA
jgi:hypothetical protein